MVDSFKEMNNMPTIIDYRPGVDSKGELLSNYDDYLVAQDGTFVYPDYDDIYDFLVRSYWPDEIANHEDMMQIALKEFDHAAFAEFSGDEFFWFEKPLKQTFKSYGLHI